MLTITRKELLEARIEAAKWKVYALEQIKWALAAEAVVALIEPNPMGIRPLNIKLPKPDLHCPWLELPAE